MREKEKKNAQFGLCSLCKSRGLVQTLYVLLFCVLVSRGSARSRESKEGNIYGVSVFVCLFSFFPGTRVDGCFVGLMISLSPLLFVCRPAPL